MQRMLCFLFEFSEELIIRVLYTYEKSYGEPSYLQLSPGTIMDWLAPSRWGVLLPVIRLLKITGSFVTL